MAAADSVNAPERTLVTTRVYDAPRDAVYRAWTDPKQLAKWFPPEGFSSPRCEVDARPGGTFRVDMKGPDGPPFDGEVFPGPGTFVEVVPNERLVFTMAPESNGRAMPTVTTAVTFEEVAGGRTRCTVAQSLETVEAFRAMAEQGMAEGIAQSMGKLAGVLSGNRTDRGISVTGRTLTLTRVFDAPRELVWAALTDPAHLTKWMFANDWEAPYAKVDVRPGGSFSIGMRPADHSQEGFDFAGTYREVVKPDRIVQRIGDGRVMTWTLTEVFGGTQLVLSLEMAMGEEQERAGYTQILDHLAAHLASGRK
ncbi:MAG TPA: SRPBCC domain-containing protein [Candidatus Limnocylindria bacterium]|nr:SRPBCC domain-containing protein [Candidatus Limnocylindria bacterium]